MVDVEKILFALEISAMHLLPCELRYPDSYTLTNYIDELKARIAELEQQQRWIPVSERLPEKSGTYLVYYKTYLEMANFDLISTKWQICFAGMITEISYWMPLPESPIVYGKESK